MMTEQDKTLRGVRVYSGKARRAGNQELWISAPLQNAIRAGLDARDWTISDLGRAIGSQPSLISRWMMGSRPSPERLIAVASALELDANHLLALAGHIPAAMDRDVDRRTQMLTNKLQDIEMTDERFAYLNSLLEVMRKTTPTMTVEDLTHAPVEDRPPRTRRSA